jgi:hypothetical protein
MTAPKIFPIGSRVRKLGGSYGGPGIVRGHATIETGEVRYLVGHRIADGYGEFLHVYPARLLAPDHTAAIIADIISAESAPS